MQYVHPEGLAMFRKLLAVVFALGFVTAATARRICPILCSGSHKIVNYIATGDSITIGLGGVPAYPFVAVATMPGATASTPGTNTPTQSPVTGIGTVFINDIAVSGISTLTLDNNYASGPGGAGAFFDGSKSLNVLTYMAGTNGSGSTDSTFSNRYWFIRDYIRKARNTGYQRVVVGTTIARDDDAGSTWTNILVPLNTQIRAYYNSDMRADGIADFGASALFSPASAADNLTNYTSDKIHPNVTGEAAMGAILEPILLTAFQSPGTQAFAPATWSPFSNGTGGLGVGSGANIDGSTSLSGDFRTAGVPTGFGNYGIRGFPGSQTGLFYWENTVTVADTVYVGIVDNYFQFNNGAFIGQDAGNDSVGYRNNGAIQIGNATVVTAASYATGDVLDTAANFNLRLVWFRRCRAGVCQPWNGNASADPTLGVTGFGVSFAAMQINGPGDRFYPAGNVHSGTDAIVSDFSASQLTQAVPSGYVTFGP